MRKLVCLVITSLIVSCTVVLAESGNEALLKQQNDALKEALAKATQVSNQLSERVTANRESQDSVMKAYRSSWVDFYDHEKMLRKHARDILYWQKFSAYIILVLVVSVTCLGVFLSFIEVRAALAVPRSILPGQQRKKIGIENDNEDGNEGGNNSEVEGASSHLVLSLTQLQITSAITGVVILVISLAFLYLFVDRVFEIDPRDFSSIHKPIEESEVEVD